MTKALITIGLVFGLWWLGSTVFTQYKQKQTREQTAERMAKTGVGADGLTGLPPHLLDSLAAAQAQGAPGLKTWLQRYASQVQDPKLADIQLDYVLALARTDPPEAKRIFQAVKNRVPSSSPVYPKVRRLESTLGN